MWSVLRWLALVTSVMNGPDCSAHLQNDNIVVAEGAKLWSPTGVTPDHLVDEILEIQGQLFNTNTLVGQGVHGQCSQIIASLMNLQFCRY